MTEPVAIEAVRRGMKELVDGTIRVSLDISPIHRAAFHRLFPDIDMPVALAPLRVQRSDVSTNNGQTEKPNSHGGQKLSQYSAQLCLSANFIEFLKAEHAELWAEVQDAAQCVRELCNVTSRAHLDQDEKAAALFHERIREPYRKWRQGNGD